MVVSGLVMGLHQQQFLCFLTLTCYDHAHCLTMINSCNSADVESSTGPNLPCGGEQAISLSR